MRINDLDKRIAEMLFRYAFIFFAGLGNLFIFYFLFTASTIYFSAFLLKFFGEVIIYSSIKTILFNDTAIEFVSACIAGSAYYLLFILAMAITLSQPKSGISRYRSTIKVGFSSINRRILILCYLFCSFFLLNVLRIVFLVLISNSKFFNEINIFSWYLLSTIFVISIWFSAVKIFSIKKIPFYSDIIYLLNKEQKND